MITVETVRSTCDVGLDDDVGCVIALEPASKEVEEAAARSESMVVRVSVDEKTLVSDTEELLLGSNVTDVVSSTIGMVVG